MCDICYEEFEVKYFYHLPKCKEHEFCVNCVQEHIENAIKAKEKDIRCMQDGCENTFTIKALEELKIADSLVTRFK